MDQNNLGSPDNGESSIERQAQHDLNEAKSTLQHDLDAVTAKAGEDVKALRQEAEAQIGAATEKAKSFASDQKNFAAGQITGVAAAINKVADEIEGDQSTTARYARDLASNLDRFGKNVQGKNVDELMGMAQQFGRSQPLAFLGAAALAGFVASRFALASAHRTQQSSQPQSGATSGTYGSSGSSSTYGGSSSYGSAGSDNGTGASPSATSTSSGSSLGSTYSQPKSTF
jgi:hypothetical protein